MCTEIKGVFFYFSKFEIASGFCRTNRVSFPVPCFASIYFFPIFTCFLTFANELSYKILLTFSPSIFDAPL